LLPRKEIPGVGTVTGFIVESAFPVSSRFQVRERYGQGLKPATRLYENYCQDESL
jgi:hypothetical protein